MAQKVCRFEVIGQQQNYVKKCIENVSFRDQYESQLQEEIGKMRNSLQSHIEMLRSSSTEHLESRLLESEQKRAKAAQEASHWRHWYFSIFKSINFKKAILIPQLFSIQVLKN